MAYGLMYFLLQLQEKFFSLLKGDQCALRHWSCMAQYCTNVVLIIPITIHVECYVDENWNTTILYDVSICTEFGHKFI